MSPGERRASVDVLWRSKEGLEMHLQIGGASYEAVLEEAQEAVEKIVTAGGEARPTGDENGKEGGPTKANPPRCSVCGRKMTYREGESRAGKPYKGFFCPESDCEGKPVWVNG